jgi:hypothetical protein
MPWLSPLNISTPSSNGPRRTSTNFKPQNWCEGGVFNPGKRLYELMLIASPLLFVCDLLYRLKRAGSSGEHTHGGITLALVDSCSSSRTLTGPFRIVWVSGVQVAICSLGDAAGRQSRRPSE